MTDRILAELAALKAASFTELRGKWQTLFDGQAPPPYNRKYVEARLAYRLQELAYGGLRPETVERLEALADEIEGTGGKRRSSVSRPIAGTRLVREWQGIEHTVIVRDNDFEYQGRPFKSLSAIARAVTGTRWNGWVFFGLKNQRRT
jgi:hypothetical protein